MGEKIKVDFDLKGNYNEWVLTDEPKKLQEKFKNLVNGVILELTTSGFLKLINNSNWPISVFYKEDSTTKSIFSKGGIFTNPNLSKIVIFNGESLNKGDKKIVPPSCLKLKSENENDQKDFFRWRKYAYQLQLDEQKTKSKFQWSEFPKLGNWSDISEEEEKKEIKNKKIEKNENIKNEEEKLVSNEDDFDDEDIVLEKAIELRPFLRKCGFEILFEIKIGETFLHNFQKPETKEPTSFEEKEIFVKIIDFKTETKGKKIFINLILKQSNKLIFNYQNEINEQKEIKK